MKLVGAGDVVGCFVNDLIAKRTKRLVSISMLIASALFGFAGLRVLQLRYLMFSHRLQPSRFMTTLISNRLPISKADLDALVSDGVSFDEAVSRTIILKAPELEGGKVSAKGVLLITFTRTFSYYYHAIDVPRLLEHFYIVLEPSWAGYCDPDIIFWSLYSRPVIVEATEYQDRNFLELLGTNLVPVSFGASDWVDHRIFRPLNMDKIYDVVYVANLTPIKRIHVFLRAIRNILRRGIKVNAALVTAQWGGQEKKLDNMLVYYRVKDSIKCFQNLNQAEVNKVFNQSKVSVLLSLKEGSNRTLFESMFANTPVIALKNNIGVNKEYINACTGLLINELKLEEAILSFQSLKYTFEPRKWAMEHIAPEVTTRKLVESINISEPSQHLKLTEISVKVNAPEACYMFPERAKYLPTASEVLAKYVIEGKIGKDL